MLDLRMRPVIISPTEQSHNECHHVDYKCILCHILCQWGVVQYNRPRSYKTFFILNAAVKVLKCSLLLAFLTFISTTNAASGSSTARKSLFFQHLSFNVQLKKNDPSLRMYENIRLPPWG